MGSKTIRSEAEARLVLGAIGLSGLSAREWARSRGVDGRSLAAWTRRLAPKLVEVVPSEPRDARPRARYLLRVREVELEFDSEVDASSLRAVLEVLRSC